MPEIAIATPFEAQEIIDIAKQEFEKRLRSLSPLTGGKEYAGFTLDFQVTIWLRRTGEEAVEARKTLAWGKVEKGDVPTKEEGDTMAPDEALATFDGARVESKFESGDPNDERIARDMPLTVETGPAGNRSRKKIRVKA